VLIVHPSADLYGSDRVMLESVDALVEVGWNVVVAIPSAGSLVSRIEERGARFVACPSPVLRKSAMTATGLVGLVVGCVTGLVPALRLIAQVRPDVVYVSTLTLPLWMLVPRLRRIPAVCHVHEAERSASSLVRRLLAAPLLLVDKVLVNSRFSGEVLVEACPPLAGRTSVLYNAVPGPPAGHVPVGPAPSSPVRLLYVGRLTRRKGVDLAIDAVARLSEGGVSATLEIVGDAVVGQPSFERELRHLVTTQNLDEFVHFHGFAPDIWPHFASCDIAVVPSRLAEPFGNTAVEAILAGRPVVTSARGGLAEATQGYGAGHTFDPDEDAGLADAIHRVLVRWADVRDGLDNDRKRAAARHAPSNYRKRLVAAVNELIRR